jgi:hypothetical protein
MKNVKKHDFCSKIDKNFEHVKHAKIKKHPVYQLLSHFTASKVQ